MKAVTVEEFKRLKLAAEPEFVPQPLGRMEALRRAMGDFSSVANRLLPASWSDAYVQPTSSPQAPETQRTDWSAPSLSPGSTAAPPATSPSGLLTAHTPGAAAQSAVKAPIDWSVPTWSPGSAPSQAPPSAKPGGTATPPKPGALNAIPGSASTAASNISAGTGTATGPASAPTQQLTIPPGWGVDAQGNVNRVGGAAGGVAWDNWLASQSGDPSLAQAKAMEGALRNGTAPAWYVKAHNANHPEAPLPIPGANPPSKPGGMASPPTAPPAQHGAGEGPMSAQKPMTMPPPKPVEAPKPATANLGGPLASADIKTPAPPAVGPTAPSAPAASPTTKLPTPRKAPMASASGTPDPFKTAAVGIRPGDFARYCALLAKRGSS